MKFIKVRILIVILTVNISHFIPAQVITFISIIILDYSNSIIFNTTSHMSPKVLTVRSKL